MNRMNLKETVRENVQMRYNFEGILGEGAFGKVKIASLIDNPEKKFAIKSIPRKLIDFGINDDEASASLDFSTGVMKKVLESEI